MSFADRLVHNLVIVRSSFDDSLGARGEYQQPAQATQEIEVRGLIQPKSARELADSRSAGVEIGDHTIFLEPREMFGSDAIRDAAGKLYSLVGIRSLEFGRTPHLEVDAQTVTPTDVGEGS